MEHPPLVNTFWSENTSRCTAIHFDLLPLLFWFHH